MAKRKRLSPALLAADIGGETGSDRPLETHSRPPIAQVAGETAEHAAFAEVTRDADRGARGGAADPASAARADRDGAPGARPHGLRRRRHGGARGVAARPRPAGAHRGRGARGGRLRPDLRSRRVMALREIGGRGAGAGPASRDLVGGLSRHGRGKRDPRRHLLLRTRAAGGGGGEARHLSRPLPRRSRRSSPRRARPSGPRSGPSCGSTRRSGMRCATPRRSPNGWVWRWPRRWTGTGRRPSGWPGRSTMRCPPTAGPSAQCSRRC
jgi:hypothetical protein